MELKEGMVSTRVGIHSPLSQPPVRVEELPISELPIIPCLVTAHQVGTQAMT